MNTHVINEVQAAMMARLMEQLLSSPRTPVEGLHSAKAAVNAGMLVEPINDHPYVFVPPNVVHQFEGERGSGTDKLRQRRLAGVFFESLVDAQAAKSKREESKAKLKMR